jgi:hypothetical protein
MERRTRGRIIKMLVGLGAGVGLFGIVAGAVGPQENSERIQVGVEAAENGDGGSVGSEGGDRVITEMNESTAALSEAGEVKPVQSTTAIAGTQPAAVTVETATSPSTQPGRKPGSQPSTTVPRPTKPSMTTSTTTSIEVETTTTIPATTIPAGKVIVDNGIFDLAGVRWGGPSEGRFITVPNCTTRSSGVVQYWFRYSDGSESTKTVKWGIHGLPMVYKDRYGNTAPWAAVANFQDPTNENVECFISGWTEH